MQERQVTIDRETYTLSPNFTVFATQNPIEYQGTYPLPEAQKDRFMFKIPMKTPERDEELALARRTLTEEAPERVLARGDVKAILDAPALAELRQGLEGITLRDELVSYVVDVVRATRTHSRVLVGAGPRATQALVLASRAYAALADRDFVTPDDIRDLAVPVLGHRLILRPEFEIEGVTIEEVADQLLKEIPVPR